MANGKRKRVSNILKKYSSKKAKPLSLPARYFEDKVNVLGAAVTVSNAGGVVPLDTIAAGVGRDDRVGNKVNFVGAECRFRITLNSAGAAEQHVRAMIVCDLQQLNSTTPTVAQILNSDIMSGEALAYKGRFKVLFDKQVILCKSGDTGAVWNWKVPMNIITEWNANTSGQVMRNGVSLLLISDQAANLPLVNYNIRMKFMDW